VIYHLVPAAEDVFHRYLEFWGRNLASRVQVLHCEDVPSLAPIPAGVYICTAMDRMSPVMASRVRTFCDRLRALDGVRLINDPARLLARFDLLAELSRAGRNDFRARRVVDDLAAVRYPVFLRDERTHDGPLSPLLRSAREVETWIGRALVLGVRLRDLLVVEFCDTSDASGLYRKYDAFVVGGRIIARGVQHRRAWVVKRLDQEFSPALAAEERTFVRENPHKRELAEICQLAGIEYGRVDYALKDGRIQVWEINTNPEIGSRGVRSHSRQVSPEVDAIRMEAKECFYAAFEAAWQALDATAAAGVSPWPARRSHPWRTVRTAIVRRIGRVRGRDHLPRAWRPVAPLLTPLAVPACAWLGRKARTAAARRRDQSRES
jgi:hypothetical protein